MTSPMAGSIQAGLRDHRGRYDNADARTGATRAFGAFKLVYRAGSLLFDVNFPYVFTERPLFSFGAELDINQSVDLGTPPTVSAVVARWFTRDNSLDSAGSQHILYTGARIAAVVGGPPDVRATVHLRFEGLSIVYPAGSRTQL